MTIFPTGGKLKAYRLLLIDALESECAQFKDPGLTGDILWDYPLTQAHSIGQNPQGNIQIAANASNPSSSIDRSDKTMTLSIKLVLRISHANYQTAIDLMCDWEYWLLYQALPKLTEASGLDGTIQINGDPLDIEKAFWQTQWTSATQYEDINQDDGISDGQVIILGTWREHNFNKDLVRWT